MADNEFPHFSTFGGHESTAGAGSETGANPQDDAVAASLVPMEFPGYEILGLIGRGGMGEVYLARDQQLDRRVAIKSMLGSADSRRLERFTDEAKAIARLDHPNIAKVLSFGSVRGIPYLVMEYLGGGTLADLPAERLSQPRSAARLAITIARAVAHAHQQGIVHRDLKPSNLLLAAETDSSTTHDARSAIDWAQRIRVADFGLAKQIGDTDQRTKTGEVLGTPSYMAPEQASGVVHKIGPAADIHAIGAILYECVTGRPPHLGGDAVQTLLLVLTTDPVSPRVLQPKLPRDLETIILKCLARQPQARYESADALADDLERWLDGKPITARRVSWLVRSTRWVRRHPAISSTIAIIAATLVLIITLQQLATNRLRAANARSQLLLDVVNEAIPQLDSIDATERRQVERKRLVAAVERLKNLAGQVPAEDSMRFQAEQMRVKYLIGLVLNAELGANVEDERHWLRELGPAIESLDQSTTQDLEVIDFQLWAWRMVAVHHDRLGDYEEAVDSLRQALDSHASFVADHPDAEASLLARRIEMLNSLGVSRHNWGEQCQFSGDETRAAELYAEAGEAFQERLALVQSELGQTLDHHDQLVADAAGALGVWHGKQQQFAEAVEQLAIATTAYERILATEPSFGARVDLVQALTNELLFRRVAGESGATLVSEASRLRAALDEVEPDLAEAPASIELAIGGRYVVAGLLRDQGELNQAVEQLDMGLRWCGYRLARLESPEPLLPLALELARERSDLLRELGEPNRQPRLVDQVDDPVVAAEAGFVLAILGEASSLNSWLKNFRSQWNDPLSNELAQRIEDLARALE
ncbi:MAG: serine/threonine-protein kinase [Pirellulaceae bacterium]